MKDIINITADHVRKQLQNAEGGHDWFHIERVWKTALYLQSKEGGNSDEISLAALLHDYSDHKYNGGDFDAGSREVLNLLNQLFHHKENSPQLRLVVMLVLLQLQLLIITHLNNL